MRVPLLPAWRGPAGSSTDVGSTGAVVVVVLVEDVDGVVDVGVSGGAAVTGAVGASTAVGPGVSPPSSEPTEHPTKDAAMTKGATAAAKRKDRVAFTLV